MAAPERPIVNPLALWGTILAGAKQGLDTQAMQAAINTQLEETGVRYGAATLPEVSRLWSQAKSMAIAGRELARAPGDHSITSQMIGVVPYGPTAAGHYGEPRYDARALYTIIENGQRISKSVVVRDIDPNVLTAGELRDLVSSYVADSASEYEGELESVDDMSIEQM